MKRLLIIAYYYPPLGMGGVKTVIPYVKYLADYGWRPEVLTVKPIAYYAYDEALAAELAPHAPVHRAGSLDPARLLRLLKGPGYRVSLGAGGLRHGGPLSRLQHALLVPDPKVLSAPFFYTAGRRLGRGGRYDALLVIAPPFSHLATADHLARALHLPWTAHLGDRWVGGWVVNSTGPLAEPAARRGERRAVERARALLCASPVEAELLRDRYPASAGKIATAPLSFDPALHARCPDHQPDSGRFTVALVGTYRGDEGVLPVLEALRTLSTTTKRRLELLHVGSTNGPSVAETAAKQGCAELVRRTGQVDYERSLAEMRRADLLLLTVAADNPHGLPGRTSDYIGSGRPILLVSDNAAARRTLEHYGIGLALGPGEETAIRKALTAALEGTGPLARPTPENARAAFAAPRRAEQLARILETWHPSGDH